MVSASTSVCVFVCVGAHLCLRLALALSPTFSSRPQSVRHGRVIPTWCKSRSFTADKYRLVNSLCAVLEAEARCLHATSTHGQCPSTGQTQAGSTVIKATLFHSSQNTNGHVVKEEVHFSALTTIIGHWVRMLEIKPGDSVL